MRPDLRIILRPAARALAAPGPTLSGAALLLACSSALRHDPAPPAHAPDLTLETSAAHVGGAHVSASASDGAPWSAQPEPRLSTEPDLSGDPRELRRRALEEEARRPKVRVTDDRAERARLALEEAARAQPGDHAKTFALARALHLAGVDGDDDAAARAEQILDDLARRWPEAPPIVTAYLGSARLLAAKRAWAPWNKGELSKEGLALLDDAIARAPLDLDVRFTRAVSCHALPFFFGRAEQAASDFERVAAGALAAVEAGTLEPEVAAAALFFHGVLRWDAGATSAAQEAWRRAVEVAPRSNHAAAARLRLVATRGRSGEG